MNEIKNFSELFDKKIIIYGAGYTGHYLYALITKEAIEINIIAFCDSYKEGNDLQTGLKIIKPCDLCQYLDAVIIIGLNDHLRISDVLEIEKIILNYNSSLKNNILHCSKFLLLFKKYKNIEFDWQNFSDNLYDFDVNIMLIKNLAQHIDKYDYNVVDLGAGGMNLCKFISPDINYYPVDFKSRCEKTIVCDFNKNEFPNIKAEVYVLCAMLYYLDDPEWLIKQCANFATRKIIIALYNRNVPDSYEIMSLSGFKNRLYFNRISDILSLHGFNIINDITIDELSRRYIVYEKANYINSSL